MGLYMWSLTIATDWSGQCHGVGTCSRDRRDLLTPITRTCSDAMTVSGSICRQAPATRWRLAVLGTSVQRPQACFQCLCSILSLVDHVFGIKMIWFDENTELHIPGAGMPMAVWLTMLTMATAMQTRWANMCINMKKQMMEIPRRAEQSSGVGSTRLEASSMSSHALLPQASNTPQCHVSPCSERPAVVLINHFAIQVRAAPKPLIIRPAAALQFRSIVKRRLHYDTRTAYMYSLRTVWVKKVAPPLNFCDISTCGEPV